MDSALEGAFSVATSALLCDAALDPKTEDVEDLAAFYVADVDWTPDLGAHSWRVARTSGR